MDLNSEIGRRFEELIYESGNLPTVLSVKLGKSKGALSGLINSGNVQKSRIFIEACKEIGANKEYILTGKGEKFTKEDHSQDEFRQKCINFEKEIKYLHTIIEEKERYIKILEEICARHIPKKGAPSGGGIQKTGT